MLLTRRAAVPVTFAFALTIAGCARRSAQPNPSVRPSPRELDASAAIAARVARTPDAVARVVAYRLDGRGPRITILGGLAGARRQHHEGAGPDRPRAAR